MYLLFAEELLKEQTKYLELIKLMAATDAEVAEY